MTTHKNPIATERAGYAAYRDYFDSFLPRIVGQLLLPDLRSLSVHAEIVVTDSGDPSWHLHLRDGRLMEIAHNGPEADCRYVLDVATVLDVVRARVTPQDAFFNMRIEIEGNIERGLELSVVLESFFERFPYREADTETGT